MNGTIMVHLPFFPMWDQHGSLLLTIQKLFYSPLHDAVVVDQDTACNIQRTGFGNTVSCLQLNIQMPCLGQHLLSRALSPC